MGRWKVPASLQDGLWPMPIVVRICDLVQHQKARKKEIKLKNLLDRLVRIGRVCVQKEPQIFKEWPLLLAGSL